MITREKIEQIMLDAIKNQDSITEASQRILDLFHVSYLFSFAKYLNENYDYFDNSNEGDIYQHKSNKLIYTEDKIYLTWVVSNDR